MHRRIPALPLVFLAVSLAAIYCVFLDVSVVSAQENAHVDGTIADVSGGAIANATVTLSATSAPADRRNAESSAEGRFSFDAPPGRYRLTITHPSFENYSEEIDLAAGANPPLRARLLIEPLSASVVVSAAPEPIATSAATSPVDIVTREAIDAGHETQLAPLLETVPGVSFGQTGPAGGVTSLFLDGGNYNYAKVLVDGVPANEPGGAVDFSYFTLANVDKIEIVHGAESALDGSDAMTGTIEILTHRGTTRTPLLVLESDGGSFGTGSGSAQLSGLAGPLDYSVGYGYFETQGQGVNDRFLDRSLSGNFGARLTPRDTLRLTLRSNTSDAGQPGQTLFTPPSFDDHDGLHNITAGLRWNFSTGTHWQHQIFVSETDIHQLYQNLLSSFYLSPDPFAECDFPREPNAVASPLYCDFTFEDRNQYNRVDAQAQSSYVMRRATLTAGYWYEVENGTLAFLNNDHVRRNNQAGFVDGRWQATSRLTVNAGFRVEDNASFSTRVVPRAGVAYALRYGHDFWGATRLRFAYGQGIKEPRLDQSFGTDPCNPGNPNLLPEQSHTLHAGIEQQLARDRLVVSGDYFANQFIDAISFNELASTQGCPFGVGEYFNTDLARARGVNLSAQTRVSRWLHVQGNYAYDDSRVLVSPNATNAAEKPGNHLLRRPVNSGSVILDGSWRRLEANLTGLFVGRRTDSDFLFPPLGLTSDPGYARFDVAATFRISGQLSLIGRVQNLFDRNYSDVLGYPALGRAIYAGVRVRLGGGE